MRFKSRKVKPLSTAVPLDPQDCQHWASWEARCKSLKNVKSIRCLLEGPHSEMALNCHSLFLHSRWKLIYLWMETSAGELMCFKICIVTSHWAGPASAFLSTDAEISCNAGIGSASGAPPTPTAEPWDRRWRGASPQSQGLAELTSSNRQKYLCLFYSMTQRNASPVGWLL